MICHAFPFPYTNTAISLRVFNLIKYLSKKYKHHITIVAFKFKDDPEEYLREYCNEVVTIELPTSPKKRYPHYVINHIIGLLLGDISLRKRNILDVTFSWRMQRKIKELLETKEFNIIFVDNYSMVPYVSDTRLPKLLTEIGNIPEVHREAYKIEKDILKKLLRLILYRGAKNYERDYEKFDACITVTKQQKDILESHLSNLNISVIPFGINIDAESEDFEEDFPSLLFLGSLDSVYNQRSILYLHKEIYPLIKEKIIGIKLYIVGKNPSKEILKLAIDNSVIVTGYVEDVRPYLARASVVTLPIHGFGIKTRLLEAMAMGKPVVISSVGIRGIDVTPEENIIVADDPEEFAERVVELLNDEALRKRIGTNARKLMEKKYSWEKMSDMLNDVLLEVVNKR
jgi:glycosyltransferase involved in cell wall biosynthesis